MGDWWLVWEGRSLNLSCPNRGFQLLRLTILFLSDFTNLCPSCLYGLITAFSKCLTCVSQLILRLCVCRCQLFNRMLRTCSILKCMLWYTLLSEGMLIDSAAAKSGRWFHRCFPPVSNPVPSFNDISSIRAEAWTSPGKCNYRVYCNDLFNFESLQNHLCAPAWCRCCRCSRMCSCKYTAKFHCPLFAFAKQKVLVTNTHTLYSLLHSNQGAI